MFASNTCNYSYPLKSLCMYGWLTFFVFKCIVWLRMIELDFTSLLEHPTIECLYQIVDEFTKCQFTNGCLLGKLLSLKFATLITPYNLQESTPIISFQNYCGRIEFFWSSSSLKWFIIIVVSNTYSCLYLVWQRNVFLLLSMKFNMNFVYVKYNQFQFKVFLIL